MTKVMYTPTIASVTRVIRGHAVTKVTYTPIIGGVLQGLDREHAVTMVTYTPTIASVTRVIRGHAVTMVTYIHIASAARVIQGARCDQGNVHTYHCQCYNGYTGGTL